MHELLPVDLSKAWLPKLAHVCVVFPVRCVSVLLCACLPVSARSDPIESHGLHSRWLRRMGGHLLGWRPDWLVAADTFIACLLGQLLGGLTVRPFLWAAVEVGSPVRPRRPAGACRLVGCRFALRWACSWYGMFAYAPSHEFTDRPFGRCLVGCFGGRLAGVLLG